MTRTTAKYVALLALATVVFYWKTLLTNQYTLIFGTEGVNQTYGWMHFWLQSIWRGHIPLWDPYSFGGRPYTNEMTGFYPFRLLFALVPFNSSGLIPRGFFDEYLAFTHFLGSVFMFALLRELGRSHFAAFIGTCAFSMGGLITRLTWPQYIESCIWLPLIFFFLLRALRAETRARALAEASLAGACLGMSILAGGIQFSMMQTIVGFTAVLYCTAVSPRVTASGLTRWIRPAMILMVFLLTGIGLGAVQLIPSFEYGRYSERWIDGGPFPMSLKIPYDRMHPGMWPQSIISALFPTGFNLQTGGGETWPIYIGVLPLFLALAAIWKRRDDLWVRYLAVLAAVMFIYSLGEFTPLHGVIYALVPYLWMVRQSSRFLFLVSFALAVLAAFGTDALPSSHAESASWAPIKPILQWLSIGCALALLAPGIFNQLSLGIWAAMSLLLIVASCAWFFRITTKPSSPVMRVMIAAFILLDLGMFNWTEANKNQLLKTGDKYEQMVTLRKPSEFIRSRPGLNRFRISVSPEPASGDIYSVQTPWGDGATVLTDEWRLSTHEDLYNVRYRIKPASSPDPGAVYQDRYWKVYEDPGAFPRAWVVHKTITEPSHEAVFAHLDTPGMSLRQVAYTESRMPAELNESGDAGGDDSVRFQSYEPDAMSLEVNTGAAGLLVLSETDYPGWYATVNKHPAEIYKTDGALRGIVVPRGSSQVELAYKPLSFYAGGTISLLTLVSVLFGWVWAHKKAFTG